MKRNLYARLALLSIKKNAKLYVPYIISCIGSVMMYYIIDFISVSETVSTIKGGSTLGALLSMGKFVVSAFAAIFLFYTNSFIIRRRNKEFGLYNVLGMDKKGIGRIIFFESALISSLSIAAGLILGIIFSKLAELLLLYIIKAEVSYSFSLPLSSVIYTVVIFAVIFTALLLRSILKVRVSGTDALLQSESSGEKAPKGNLFIGVCGVIILGAAYAISIFTKSPLSAISNFLIAVIMVIAATYILFMAGSVALCRVLRKNKKYYYKKNHFFSVSSMAYRMKRNGAGLASVCILSTMVLVMIASSASLYFGAEDSIKSRFPIDNQIIAFPTTVEVLDEEHLDLFESNCDKVFSQQGVTPERTEKYSYADISGIFYGDTFEPDISNAAGGFLSAGNIKTLYFMTVSDYNRNMGTQYKLSAGQAMTATIRCTFDNKKLKVGEAEFEIVERLSEFPEISLANVTVVPSVMVVINDFSELKSLDSLADYNGNRMLESCIYYGYDLNESDERQIEVMKAQKDALGDVEFIHRENGGYSFTSDCLAEEKDDFYVTYGGLFYIGILLSVIFIAAMAMIIYYKQITEGYEDRMSFEIMQKVGMTKSDISKSINSQTLTVFFAPLIMAGVHLCFAFPPIWKLLILFNLNNLPFVIAVTSAAFVLFGVFYVGLYKITSNAYFSIVSSDKK